MDGREAIAAQPPAEVDKGNGRASQVRYRVDATYRAYQGRTGSSTSDGGSSNTKVQKISSAKLLDSMIFQMGGALRSSAKGTFVDITI